jgi:outer membrane protein
MGRNAAVVFVVLGLSAIGVPAQQARTITLADAIQIALRQSSDVTRAENEIALNQLAVSDAKSRFLPNLSFSTSTAQTYGRAFNEAEGGLVNQSTGTMNLRASSSVTLFDGFANLANLRGAQFGAAAGELNAERTRQTVVLNVASGFLAVVEAQEQARVARENLAAQHKREAEIQTLVKAGTRPIADLYSQQSTVASARSALVNAQRTESVAQLDLVQTMRLDPVASYAFQAPEQKDVTELEATPDAANLVAAALKRRTDLQALSTQVDAAETGVQAARASRYPTVSISAGYGSNYSSASDLGLGDQLNERRSGSLAVAVSVPVFDRGETGRAVERANIEVDNAKLAAQDLQRQIAAEVQRALLDRASAQASLEAAEARVTASAKALEAMERRYQAGVATLFEVTQTRADLVDATSAAVRAR